MNSIYLYKLCLPAACRALDPPFNVDSVDDIAIIGQLPFTIECDIRKVLKFRWMKKIRPPENPYTFEYKNLSNLHPVDKHDFIMLMRLPVIFYSDIWPAHNDHGHLNFDYYEFHNNHHQEYYVLCRPCFLKTSRPNHTDDDFDYTEYWRNKNWTFFNVVTHSVVSPSEFVKNVLKAANSWCDRCILTPLFSLYNWEQCKGESDVHNYNSDSDTTDDSLIETYQRVELLDHYM